MSIVLPRSILLASQDARHFDIAFFVRRDLSGLRIEVCTETVARDLFCFEGRQRLHKPAVELLPLTTDRSFVDSLGESRRTRSRHLRLKSPETS